MAMSADGVGRNRWIRILIVILALTASRTNFPLSKLAGLPTQRSSKALSSRTHDTPKKYEGVTPSRRNVESRRTDWLECIKSESSPTSPAHDELFPNYAPACPPL